MITGQSDRQARLGYYLLQEPWTLFIRSLFQPTAFREETETMALAGAYVHDAAAEPGHSAVRLSYRLIVSYWSCVALSRPLPRTTLGGGLLTV